MNSYLLYPQQNLSSEKAYPSFADIEKDLNLTIIRRTMARDDPYMMEQIRSVMMVPVCDPAVIMYRCDIIRNFYTQESLVNEMYELGRQGAVLSSRYREECEQNRHKSTSKTGFILSTLSFMEKSISLLRRLADLLTDQKEQLHADGLLRLRERLSGYPLEEFDEFHKQILFYTTGGEGVFSIRMSGGLKLEQSRLLHCQQNKEQNGKLTSNKLFRLYVKAVKKDTVLIEDEMLDRELRQFVELHMEQLMKFYEPLIAGIQAFWREFGREISFYKGVHTLQTRMDEFKLPFCYGECSDDGQKQIDELYELSLALYVQKKPVPNSFHDKQTTLTIITGANQGGKSTFLRSLGIAQVMMQCGMPIPASKFKTRLYERIHTHFTRKEDAMLSRGRLEEELKRMSGIVSQLVSNSLLLLNESFASTTEKEGSKIAYGIIMPLYEKKIEVMMVTHLHEFASSMYEKNLTGTQFLVAERTKNGDRTFRMLPGKPHYSSYGTDLFQAMIEGEQTLTD